MFLLSQISASVCDAAEDAAIGQLDNTVAAAHADTAGIEERHVFAVLLDRLFKRGVRVPEEHKVGIACVTLVNERGQTRLCREKVSVSEHYAIFAKLQCGSVGDARGEQITVAAYRKGGNAKL